MRINVLPDPKDDWFEQASNRIAAALGSTLGIGFVVFVGWAVSKATGWFSFTEWTVGYILLTAWGKSWEETKP